jgi:hypothetical protein
MDFGNDKGNNFVHHEFITEKLGGGASALVKRSLTGSNVSLCQINPEDVSFNMAFFQISSGVLLKRLSSVCRHNLKNYGYVSG